MYRSVGIVSNYNLTHSDPSYFLTSLTFEKVSFFDKKFIKRFCKDLSYDFNYGDRSQVDIM